MASDLETYLAAVEERDTRAKVDLERFSRDDSEVIASQADVPTLLAMVRELLLVASAHVRKPQESDVVKCLCGECGTGRKIAKLAREAMEKRGG